eukprot:g4059.t1
MSGYDTTPGELRNLFEQRDTLAQLEKLGDVAGICRKLNVDPKLGVDKASVEGRREAFGENRIPERPPTTYLEILYGAFQDFTIIMLVCAAIASIIVCIAFEMQEHPDSLCWIEGTAIILTVILVTNVAALQDYQKEQQFRLLNADVENIEINVVRDGQRLSVSRYDLVVGDIVRLSIGDILEGDGLLVEGFDVETDESALTGEPILIAKNPQHPFLLSGSSIQKGQGTYVLIAVGVNSEKGRIQALVRGQKLAGEQGQEGGDEAKEEGKGGEKKEEEEEEEEEKSLLTKKLDATAELIGVMAMRIAGLALIGMALNWVIDQGEDTFADGPALRDEAIQWVIMAITIVVVAVPEGLPLAVTLALSLSVGRMQEDKCLVKRLDSTETMGSATCICTDKTGTLTENRMTVVQAYFGGEIVDPIKAGTSETCGSRGKAMTSENFREKLCYGICANKAEAEIEFDQTIGLWTQKGNKTDCALLAFAHDMGFNYKEVNFSMSMAAKIYPFSSQRKRAGIVVPNPGGNGYRVFIKGASEIVLALCDKRLNGKTDAVDPFSEDDKRKVISDVITPFATASLRTIGLAYKEVREMDTDWERTLSAEEATRITGQDAETYVQETGLTFLGLVGIEDPLRSTVPPAIEKCNKAGVDVRMVTGDNIDTAVAISKQCGILRKGVDLDADGNVLNNAVMSGPAFRERILLGGADSGGSKINQEEFDRIWPTLRVLARSSPTDKYLLVTGIIESDLFKERQKSMELGIYPDRQVVAVTGDGTNDAPALKRADVGFVMGLTGTSVAKDASDIVITNDDFSAIVEACKWGRNVYDSISKFLQFQLTVNIVAVTLACLGSFVDRVSPLRAVQMLWVNLIMDSLGALALASEPPVPELLERPPYGRNKPLLSFQMKFNMFGQAVYQLIVLLILLYGSAGERGRKMPQEANNARSYFMPSEVSGTASNFDIWHCDARDHKVEWAKKVLNADVTEAQVDAALAPAGGICSNCDGFLDIPNGRALDASGPPCQHYTLIFNTFVMMQLFNWINCRKLYHEYNPFQGIQNNRTFIIIWITCFIIQVLLVEIGAIGKSGLELACDAHNMAFRTTHLTGTQWVISMVAGIFSLPWQWVLITIAKAFFPEMEKMDVYALAGDWHGTEEREKEEKEKHEKH